MGKAIGADDIMQLCYRVLFTSKIELHFYDGYRELLLLCDTLVICRQILLFSV